MIMNFTAHLRVVYGNHKHKKEEKEEVLFNNNNNAQFYGTLYLAKYKTQLTVQKMPKIYTQQTKSED